MRYSATAFAPLIEYVGGDREPWLEGYRIKIIDGNCLEASHRRLKPLREVQSATLPGKSLVVYKPSSGLVTDVIPCEDGHAQERALFSAVLQTVREDDLWIADRNFCTRDFLGELDRQGGSLSFANIGVSRLRWSAPLGLNTAPRPGLWPSNGYAFAIQLENSIRAVAYGSSSTSRPEMETVVSIS